MNLSGISNPFTTLANAGAMPSASPEQESSDTNEDEPQFPLNLPYVASCGDVYCYHCIAERMMRAADEEPDEGGWKCLRCGQNVKHSDRSKGDDG